MVSAPWKASTLIPDPIQPNGAVVPVLPTEALVASMATGRLTEST